MQKINRLQSFQCAFAGIRHTLKTQRNAQIHLTIGAIIITVGTLLQLSLTEWAVIALTTGFVLAVEMLNTVIEAIMDYLNGEFDPRIRVIKDVAAGAVLTAAITAVIVGLLILGPALFARLSMGP